MEISRPAFRPLLAAVLALAVGGWIGSEVADFGREAWRAAVWASLALAAASALGGSRARAAAAGLLLFALGGLRARDEALSPAVRQGRFEPRREMEGSVRGPLAPGRLDVEFEIGLVDAGEEIEVRGGTPASARARGPVEPPPPRSDAPRIAVLPDEIVRLGPAPDDFAHGLSRRLESGRSALRERLGRIEDREARGLAAALVLGDLGGLDPELPDLFVRTGTFHALAVSGVQVVLVAGVLLAPFVALVAWLARGLGARRARIVREAARALALAVYVPIAGSGPPVARAALAFALARAAPLVPAHERARVAASGEASAGSRLVRLARRPDGLSLWSLALAVECALHPRAAAELSVQLSYAATLGLVLGTAPLRRLLQLPIPSAVDALGRPRSPFARACRVRLQVGIVGAIAASSAAVGATLPFVWWRLGEWAPLGILATLAIATPAAILLVGGWIASIAPEFVPDAVLVTPARAMLATLRVFDALPGTPDALPPRPAWLVFAAVALAFAALVVRSNANRRALARVAASLAALLLVPWTTGPRGLEVHALDVGHGTCCIVRAPGLGTWIFDAGSRDRAEVARAALGPALRAFDAGRVGVVLSHADRDHDGALPWLVSRFDVAAYAGALSAQVAERLPHTVPRLDLPAGRTALPALQGSCPGVEAWIERGVDALGNEGSRLLHVDWFGEHVVLSGDAEAEGLRAWLAAVPRAGPVRLFLAPHHGSEIERLGLLLDALRPREVWISGPARPPIAGELDRRGIPWRSTGTDGPLRLELDSPGDAAWWNGTCPEAPP
ncbi:MAG: ComEC/Rec2 family competence protein [Planctomycetota bacterium]|nr:ComEC/Rec2 family competence protein [Planctomycetota bacterium]